MLARDHIGLRRVYYALLPGGGLAFASEIQALLQEPGVSREWSPDAIDAYLALGYVPAPLTAYRRISKLEPAQLLQVDGRRLHLEQYLGHPGGRAGQRRAGRTARNARGAAARDSPPPGRRRGWPDLLRQHCIDGAAGGVSARRHRAGHRGRRRGRLGADAQRSGRLAAGTRTSARAGGAGGDDAGRRIRGARPRTDCRSSAVAQLAVLRAVGRHADTAFAAHGAAAIWAGCPEHPVERDHGKLEDVQAARRVYSTWDDRRRRAIYTREFAWQVRDADPFGRHLALHASHPSDDPLDARAPCPPAHGARRPGAGIRRPRSARRRRIASVPLPRPRPRRPRGDHAAGPSSGAA